MPMRVFASLENFLNPLVRNPFLEHVSHAADEDCLRFFDFLRVVEAIAMEGGGESKWIRCFNGFTCFCCFVKWVIKLVKVAGRMIVSTVTAPTAGFQIGISIKSLKPLRNAPCVAVFTPVQATRDGIP